MKKKTKIVCTLGPAMDMEGKLEELMIAGFDVARLNFSHGDHAEQGARMDKIRELNKKIGKDVALLLDTKGPEIRTGEVQGKLKLEMGKTIILTSEEVVGTVDKISISYGSLHNEVRIGNEILLDDGLVSLEVVDISGREITCLIKNSGELGSKKGVNIPDVAINLPRISEKDRKDILFAIEKKVNFIALSFVRDKEDILVAREILKQHNSDIKLISKIESKLAIENLEEIIKASDGIMVARGDLGVEIPICNIPRVQKELIFQARKMGKPVIVATQMLDSMIRNPRPTRAEVNDVANSIYDGADALMLSGETANGTYPIEALKMMRSVIKDAEVDLRKFEPVVFKTMLKANNDEKDQICLAAVEMARNINAKCIFVPTLTGNSALMIARLRPSIPIVALVKDDRVKTMLNLAWGVQAFVKKEEFNSFDHLIEEGIKILKNEGKFRKGDAIVIMAGIPLRVEGQINLIKSHKLD